MISRKHEVEMRLIESSLAVSAQLAEMRFQQTELIGRFQDQVSMHEEALDKIIQQQLGLEAMSKVSNKTDLVFLTAYTNKENSTLTLLLVFALIRSSMPHLKLPCH
jgi:hypothetical protein